LSSQEPPATLFQPIFRLDLPHGRCVGVALPEWDVASDALAYAEVRALAEEERRHLETLPEGRRVNWAGGRIALHAALADLGVDAGPILSTPRGAPQLPARARGSISHKESLAVALAARAEVDEHASRLGIDIERVVPGKLDISKRVLRPDELAFLPPPGDPRRTEELAFAFSAKEAIYKALDPFLARYVSFQEVAVDRSSDGTAFATLDLRDGSSASFEVDVRWFRRDDFIITTARVSYS
jgi:4'-phosphopantetheinyl transferase EntD